MSETIHEGRYYNANGFAVSIIAVINEGIDWAAYIGSTDGEMFSERQTMNFVSHFGCKLSREDARYYFPGIDLPYRE